MSLLKAIDTNPSFTPRESGPLPDRLISGDPAFRTWAQDVARGESIHTGVWEATPGEMRSIKGETFEFCHILSGIVELTPEGGEPVIYKAGDSFVMKPGSRRLEDHRNRAQDLRDRDVMPMPGPDRLPGLREATC